jgi:hypothetical protein
MKGQEVDGCHANTAGQASLGKQAVAFWGWAGQGPLGVGNKLYYLLELFLRFSETLPGATVARGSRLASTRPPSEG